MKMHYYKYGGKTTSSHPSCPARVLMGWRCQKGCPLRGECQEGVGLQWIDHAHMLKNEDGTNTFVSVHYYDPQERIDAVKEYLEFHGLTTVVKKAPFKGMATAWYVLFHKQNETGNVGGAK